MTTPSGRILIWDETAQEWFDYSVIVADDQAQSQEVSNVD
jgi:hypothetical protein